MIINRATFEQATSTNESVNRMVEKYGDIFGTVEVTISRKVQRLECLMTAKGEIYVPGWLGGVTGRYVTGKKAWPATITQDAEGRERVRFGRDDYDPKFSKANCLHFAK